jgi:hypothetical protein
MGFQFFLTSSSSTHTSEREREAETRFLLESSVNPGFFGSQD